MGTGDGTGQAVLGQGPWKQHFQTWQRSCGQSCACRGSGTPGESSGFWFLVISSPTWVCHLKAIPEDVTDTEAGNLDHLTMPHPSVCHPSAYQSSQTVELMGLHVSPAVPALLPLCPLGSDLRIYDKFLSKTHPLPMDFILRVFEMRKDPEPLIQWRPCVAFWYPNSWRKVYLRQECKAHELHRFHFSPFQWGQNYGLKQKCGPYHDSEGIKTFQRCMGEKSENSHYQPEQSHLLFITKKPSKYKLLVMIA